MNRPSRREAVRPTAIGALLIAILMLGTNIARSQTGSDSRATLPGDLSHQIVNARLTTRTATTPLAREVASAAASGETMWIAWRVAVTPGARQMCSSWAPNGAPQILLEPPGEMTVLARVESRQVVRVQTATPECSVDAGGLPVLYLTGVSVTDSADWLAGVVQSAPAPGRGRSRLLEPALAALAWHQGEAAARALVATARQDSRPAVRSKALFWLAQRAGQEAVAAIGEAASQDPDIDVKKKAVFALSQLPGDAGVPLLITLARSHASREVRRQAMFWLGQTKDPRAVSFFEELLTARP